MSGAEDSGVVMPAPHSTAVLSLLTDMSRKVGGRGALGNAMRGALGGAMRGGIGWSRVGEGRGGGGGALDVQKP